MRRDAGDTFVAAVSLVCGVLAWLQMPAVCGFMLSSTLRGAGNYIYSIWLGVLIAIVGLAAGLPSLLRRNRHALLVAGMALGAGFIAFAAVGHRWYDEACHAIYEEFPLPPSG
jgi:hypothetical protein